MFIFGSKSTEQFSRLPYIYALLNCLICLWYRTPIISLSIILIFTVNFVGAIFQLIYIIIFFVYGDRTKKVKMLGLLLAVFSAFGAIVVLSIKVFEPLNRQLLVGYLSVFSLISMFASPLFIINLVIRTKSVPNGTGAILGVIQLVLYFCYSRKFGKELRRPLLESYA
ncbi:bidirectional sugar transporter SWEET2a-like [Olea europaea subsp. europaea]|uniref:Bidirectional sugar transporter SWEET2a-like n=1 Tax=Olea europaea subsp. europaea TaxID=158383 RepID=A0A8S0S974_OLEEU|nr:bidirectional sugar transporter SWEET2a-like [Olea europaea subsp. europaea]